MNKVIIAAHDRKQAMEKLETLGISATSAPKEYPCVFWISLDGMCSKSITLDAAWTPEKIDAARFRLERHFEKFVRTMGNVNLRTNQVSFR